MQETRHSLSLPISTTPKKHVKGPANNTNTQGTALVEGKSQHKVSRNPEKHTLDTPPKETFSYKGVEMPQKKSYNWGNLEGESLI